MLLQMNYCMFIDCQQHWTPENYTERNQSLQE